MKPHFLAALIALALSLVACDRPAAPPAPIAKPPVESSENTPPEPVTKMVIAAGGPSEAPSKTADHQPLQQPAQVLRLPAGARLDAGNDPNPDLVQGQALFSALYEARGLRFVYGAGTRRLVVFSDPGSLFDLQLFQMLQANAENLDATIVVLPVYPPDRPDARLKAQALFCAQDPENVWKAWIEAAAANTTSNFASDGRIPEVAWQGFVRRNPVTATSCSPAQQSALAGFSQAASQIGVGWTPTAVFAHGQAWPGPLLGREDLEKVWWYVNGRLGLASQEL